MVGHHHMEDEISVSKSKYSIPSQNQYTTIQLNRNDSNDSQITTTTEDDISPYDGNNTTSPLLTYSQSTLTNSDIFSHTSSSNISNISTKKIKKKGPIDAKRDNDIDFALGRHRRLMKSHAQWLQHGSSSRSYPSTLSQMTYASKASHTGTSYDTSTACYDRSDRVTVVTRSTMPGVRPPPNKKSNGNRTKSVTLSYTEQLAEHMAVMASATGNHYRNPVGRPLVDPPRGRINNPGSLAVCVPPPPITLCVASHIPGHNSHPSTEIVSRYSREFKESSTALKLHAKAALTEIVRRQVVTYDTRIVETGAVLKVRDLKYVFFDFAPQVVDGIYGTDTICFLFATSSLTFA